MGAEADDKSLFASTQSMGAFGSLPLNDVGPVSQIEPHDELEVEGDEFDEEE